MITVVEEALAMIGAAAKNDDVESWFIAVRDPDSNERHCRIHGDMEEGFAIANLALSGQAGAALSQEECPNLFAALSGPLLKAGATTWVFICRMPSGVGKGIIRMSFVAPDRPEAAMGLGVVCLQMMINSMLSGPTQFALLSDKP